VYSPGFSGANVSIPDCDKSQLSTTDPHLTPAPSRYAFGDGYGFRDSAGDQQADPANRLSFSVNVSECLGTSWNPGESVNMWLVGGVSEGSGAVGTNSTTQVLRFTRQ
jgi:hypothetical protein